MAKKKLFFKADTGPRYSAKLNEIVSNNLSHHGVQTNPHGLHISFGKSAKMGLSNNDKKQIATHIKTELTANFQKTFYAVPDRLELYIDSGNFKDENQISIKDVPTRDNNWLLLVYKKQPVDISKLTNHQSVKKQTVTKLNDIYVEAMSKQGKEVGKYSTKDAYMPHVSIAKIPHNKIVEFKNYFDKNQDTLFETITKGLRPLAIYKYILQYVNSNGQTENIGANGEKISVTKSIHEASSWHGEFTIDDVKQCAAEMDFSGGAADSAVDFG